MCYEYGWGFRSPACKPRAESVRLLTSILQSAKKRIEEGLFGDWPEMQKRSGLQAAAPLARKDAGLRYAIGPEQDRRSSAPGHGRRRRGFSACCSPQYGSPAGRQCPGPWRAAAAQSRSLPAEPPTDRRPLRREAKGREVKSAKVAGAGACQISGYVPRRVTSQIRDLPQSDHLARLPSGSAHRHHRDAPDHLKPRVGGDHVGCLPWRVRRHGCHIL